MASKYIKFEEAGTSKSGLTKLYAVWATKDYALLGEIKWFWRWRKYAFLPVVGTLFEEGCMRTIADFCEQKTKELRAAKRAKAA